MKIRTNSRKLLDGITRIQKEANEKKSKLLRSLVRLNPDHKPPIPRDPIADYQHQQDMVNEKALAKDSYQKLKAQMEQMEQLGFDE